MSKVPNLKSKKGMTVSNLQPQDDLYVLQIDCEDIYFSCIKTYQNSKVNIAKYLRGKLKSFLKSFR